MILYHGTNAVFDEIDLTKSKPNKDLSKFYESISDFPSTHLAHQYAQKLS